MFPATKVKQFDHLGKQNNLTVLFLGIQEQPTLTNYLPNLPRGLGHICLTKNQPFDFIH